MFTFFKTKKKNALPELNKKDLEKGKYTKKINKIHNIIIPII